MTGDLCQVPLGALTVSGQLRAELAYNFTNPWWVTTKKACGVPPSLRLRDTTDL